MRLRSIKKTNETTFGRSTGPSVCSRSRRGTATVELTLLLPFLIFLFVIAVDFGRVFYFSLTLENSARSGAIYASDPIAAKQSPYTSIQQAALSETQNLATPPTVTSTNGTDASGNPYVAVTVVGQFQTITSFPGIAKTTTLSRTVQMRTAPAAPN